MSYPSSSQWLSELLDHFQLSPLCLYPAFWSLQPVFPFLCASHLNQILFALELLCSCIVFLQFQHHWHQSPLPSQTNVDFSISVPGAPLSLFHHTQCPAPSLLSPKEPRLPLSLRLFNWKIHLPRQKQHKRPKLAVPACSREMEKIGKGGWTAVSRV